MNCTYLHGGLTGARLRVLAVLALAATPLFGQTVTLGAPASVDIPATAGEYLVLPDLPRPEWRTEGGSAVARLRISAPPAAAWRVAFRSLSLASGAQMFLQGVDSSGALQAVHGPYEGHGPLNVPEFESNVVPGADLVIEVRAGSQLGGWPFQLQSAERITDNQLSALRESGTTIESIYRPERTERQMSEVRSAWIDGELVPYRVVDGLAISEGDMILGTAEEVAASRPAKRDGRHESHEISGLSFLWPGGVMPYTIEYSSSGIVAGSTLDTRIRAAISYWNQRFPGILVARTTETAYVTIRHKSGVCDATVGHYGVQQFIRVSLGCSQGTIVHEIGHALGFRHEHQRPDRDQYVRIVWNKILDDYTDNFVSYTTNESRSIGTYDFGSIMHYDTTSFSKDGSATLVLLQTPPSGTVVGQRTGLSAGDESAVRWRYCHPGRYTYSPRGGVDVPRSGGVFSFTVTAPPYCSWTVSEDAQWITLGAPALRTGTSTVFFSVSATGAPRNSGIMVSPVGGPWLINGQSVMVRKRVSISQ